MNTRFDLESRGALPSDRELNECESLIGRRLPTDYRSFLLSINGGVFRPPSYDKFYLLVFPDAEASVAGDVSVAEFYGLYDDNPGSDLSWVVRVARESHGFPAHLIPIACSACGDWIALSIEPSEYFGSVHFVYHDKPDPGGANVTYLASSFTEFVAGLAISSNFV